MLTHLRQPPQIQSSGPSFAGLMELYESNYIYLRRLAPDLDGAHDDRVSSLDRAPDLHLTVTERCAYTTSLSLTHRFGLGGIKESLPDLPVRIYHDARVAEVIPQPGTRASLAWRWAANRFLNRWLKYCLGEGHAFATAEAMAVVLRPEARRWSV